MFAARILIVKFSQINTIYKIVGEIDRHHCDRCRGNASDLRYKLPPSKYNKQNIKLKMQSSRYFI